MLIYLFMQEKPVDVGLLVLNSLKKVVVDQDSTIMLPHIISALCTDLGVQQYEGDLKFKPKPSFKYTSIKSLWDAYKQQYPEPAPENTAREDQSAPSENAEPPTSDHPQPSIQAILTLLQEMKGDITHCMTAFQDFDGRLLRLETIVAEHFQGRA